MTVKSITFRDSAIPRCRIPSEASFGKLRRSAWEWILGDALVSLTLRHGLMCEARDTDMSIHREAWAPRESNGDFTEVLIPVSNGMQMTQISSVPPQRHFFR